VAPPRSRPSALSEATLTTSTADSTGGARSPVRMQGLAVLLEGDRLRAGGTLVALEGAARVEIGRGAKRETRLEGGVLRLDLPDARISTRHAELLRSGPRWELLDLGSSNGSFVGAERVARAPLEPGEVFRVGHTWLAIVDDAGPLVGRERSGRPPWPFPTLSAELARELERLERIATAPITLLLLGETGTGKEVLARAAHGRSGRPGAFVAVNCGALPGNLVEAQLFGHERGAFSGALRDEPGFVRVADRGTLFLDEIGDLPPGAQAALLRVLQEGEVTPVGAFKPVAVDVRVIAATHRPLDAMIADGSFRADLFARLAGFTFRLPPLRARAVDVGSLLASFVPEGEAPPQIRPDAALALLEHDYPMNVRELRQAFETAMVLAGDVIRLAHLPEAFRAEPGATALRSSTPPRTVTLSAEDEAIRVELVQRLAATGNNVSQVAREMGKARQQIQRWMRRFGL
jgi:transcriptional regulator of acetoin/glycerol metabolism